jgi:hypothetical protein
VHEHVALELRALQGALTTLYSLEPAPDVVEFVRQPVGQRHETVLVHQPDADTLELSLLLPEHLDTRESWSADDQLGLVEGVSHFLYLSERARVELPTTQLELELQAEVDKFALMAALHWEGPRHSLWALHEWLFERASFLHPAHTERGHRYRLANQLAARLCSRLLTQADSARRLSTLRQFYRRGQHEKIRLAQAA